MQTNYLNAEITLKSWLCSTDHKRVAILYLIAITGFFALGAAAISVVRLALLSPSGTVVTADTYNKSFTMHGVIMVWFFLIPSIPTVMGNFCYLS